jgi:hypothetical protein
LDIIPGLDEYEEATNGWVGDGWHIMGPPEWQEGGGDDTPDDQGDDGPDEEPPQIYYCYYQPVPTGPGPMFAPDGPAVLPRQFLGASGPSASGDVSRVTQGSAQLATVGAAGPQPGGGAGGVQRNQGQGGAEEEPSWWERVPFIGPWFRRRRLICTAIRKTNSNVDRLYHYADPNGDRGCDPTRVRRIPKEGADLIQDLEEEAVDEYNRGGVPIPHF